MSDFRFLGIDLGTTNTAAALSDGQRVEPVRMSDGGVLLPSVVRIDAHKNLVVGQRARRFLDSDPANTHAEFKRLMGSESVLSFRSAKLEKKPEELSAAVLETIRNEVTPLLSGPPRQAVITVPALFELPQIRATAEAARIAGFERVEHLQEPVASALAAGWDTESQEVAPWLVYDLGGGTFDVSLLETREGVLRVVDHDGDNFLGGRDMDAAVLDIVLGALSTELGKELSRANPELRLVLRKLRFACEEAKFALGRGEDTSVALPEPILIDGDEVLVDVPIRVSDFIPKVMPLIDRSIEVAYRLLARTGVMPDSLGRIVLVGGPTVMSILRDRVAERLVAPFAKNIDPMTAVANGAALFAATHSLDARGTAPLPRAATANATATARVWLQAPGVSGDLHPYLVGKVLEADRSRMKAITATRAGGGFTSSEESIDEDGSFAIALSLVSRAASEFTLEVLLDDGVRVGTLPASIVIHHGIALADPPVSRSIGVALANGGVTVFFEKGAPLPTRKTFRLRAANAVRPGDEKALRIPLVQGEFRSAELCRRVGEITVSAVDLKEPLAVGAPIDVTLELDRGGKLSATAMIPATQQVFEGLLELVLPDLDLAEVALRIAGFHRRIATLKADAYVPDEARRSLVAIEIRTGDAAFELECAKGGDPDAVEKVRRMLVDIDGELADVEASKGWPTLEARGRNALLSSKQSVSIFGTGDEQAALAELEKSLQRSKKSGNIRDYENRVGQIVALGNAAYYRNPENWEDEFKYAANRLSEMHDAKEGQAAIREGEKALTTKNYDVLKACTHRLWKLLPPSPERQRQGHGSGVLD